jgi:hypothetical protein
MLRKWRHDRYQKSLHARGWYDLTVRLDDPAIFMGGCDRSGTTLFKSVLDRHPRIACGPETSIWGRPFRIGSLGILWEIPTQELVDRAKSAPNLPQFASDFYKDYLLAPDDKQRWADKTPNNIYAIPNILTWYPNAKVIHLIRDGRDVVCSLRHHRKEHIKNGKIVPRHNNNPIGLCAQKWLEETSAGLPFRNHPRYLEVIYEQFLEDPEAILKKVCDFIEEDYSPQMLDTSIVTKCSQLIGSKLNNPGADRPIERGSLNRWEKDLTPEEQHTFNNIAGHLLIALGYAKDDSWLDQK